MKKRLIICLTVLLLAVSLIPAAAFAADNPFGDVPETIGDRVNPFYDSILWAVEQKITTGYSDGTFRPDATCTRGHVVTFLWRAAGSPKPVNLNNTFTDVSEDSPFYFAILWASEKGITTGYPDGTFRPSASCTRAHVVTFLWRYEGRPESNGDVSLTDLAGLNSDFTAAIKWAATNGITTGYSDGTFRPHAVCTRAHVVTFINRNVSNSKPHTHSYTSRVTAPTCTEKGYTTYTCSCGDSYKDSYVDALGHKTEILNAKEAGCTEEGYTGDSICSVCGEKLSVGQMVDALGHSWNEGTVITAAKIGTSGLKRYTCTVCGEIRDETIPPLDYEAKWRIVKEHQDWGNGVFVNIIYEYDTYGNILKKTVVDENGSKINMTYSYYDSEHTLLKSITYTSVVQKLLYIKETEIQRESYEYNSAGQITRSRLDVIDNKAWFEENSVYENGLLVSRSSSDSDGTKEIINYEYENGVLVKSSKKDGAGKHLSETSYTYDNKGNLICAEEQSGDLTHLLTLTTYEYISSDGKYLLSKEVFKDFSDRSNGYTHICEYDSKGNLTVMKEYNCNDTLYYTLTYTYEFK